MPPAPATPDILLQDISVAFGTVQALDGVTVHFRPGERHAVVGENGAGKSTLMRVLFGLQTATRGEIRLNDAPIRFASPRNAMTNGIGMVQQHFELVKAFTVAENILLGAESSAIRGPLFHRERAYEMVRHLAEQNGLPVDPSAQVGDLSVAAQQRIEILKALYRNAQVLILDEPTAVLSPSEAADLWKAVAGFSGAGKTVIFVTHKLDEVMENADTVTVLRRGKHILSSPIERTTPEALSQAMVGDAIVPSIYAPARSSEAGDRLPAAPPILRLEGLTVRDTRGIAVVQDASLSIRAGEIVGIAGVDGSGQTELLEAIVGLRAPSMGKILLHDQEVTCLSVARRRERGIAYVPADRHRQAVVLPLTCEENAILGQERQPSFSVRGVLRLEKVAAFLTERAASFDVRGAAVGLPLAALSGGNQQKLVLARELSRSPRLLIAAQPTRGLDFAATAFVHRTLLQERDAGCAILLQSLDLGEVLSLSDRVAVMHAGRIVAILEGTEATSERIGALMMGVGEAAPIA